MLVQRYAGIGDIVCTLPSITMLRKNEPGIILIYETRRANVPMLESCPALDLVVEEGTLLATHCHRFLRPKVILYPLLPDERTPPEQRKRIHLVEEFGKSFGFSSLSEQNAQLDVSIKEQKQMRQRLQKAQLENNLIAVIHTGPTWQVKEWSASNWEKLVTQLKNELGVVVIQIGHDYFGTGEASLSPRIKGTVDWVGELSIKQILALLKMTKVFIGIDSGMLHLAGAVSAPCVGLFGPTDPICFLPRNSLALGVTSKVECLGCHHNIQGPLHWRNGCPNAIRCMSELSVNDVYSACSQFINQGKN